MISVVVPIYNEEEIIALLHRAVVDAMNETGEEWEVVYVNDGSKDSSLEQLRELHSAEPRVIVVDLSRNWGHMGALSAGLRTAGGDAVILMDADLQGSSGGDSAVRSRLARRGAGCDRGKKTKG